MSHTFLFLAALNGAVAVALGAFGAHALKLRLSADMLAVWQTAVQYHFIHLLALLVVALLARELPDKAHLSLTISGVGFVLGMLLFCGSLYGLALGGPRWLGPITPLGGLTFIIAWLALAYHALPLR